MVRHVSAFWCAFVVPFTAVAGVWISPEPGSQPLRVRKQVLTVEVKDQVARATLDEVFENQTDKPLEGTYELPLPDGAAVSGFATWVDGKRVESHIQQTREAERNYQDAKERKQAPALLEKNAAGLFRMKVDAIPPHGTKRIEAAFAQILPYDSGTVTLRIPAATRGPQGAEQVGDFRASFDIEDQKPISKLEVLSHPASVERVGPHRFRVTLEGKNAQPGQDLVVAYQTESSRLGLSFVPYKPEGTQEGYFLLLASPQELTAAEDIVHKDIVFVFDTSGSMSAESKIEQSRQALQRCLSYLNPEDRFGIVAFSDSVNPFRNTLIPATGQNVSAGIAFANGLRASGGTDIAAALFKGMALLDGSERPRVIVFMTDGQPTSGVTDPQTISHLVQEKNQGRARLFSFGVGSDVNRTFLEQLAKENRGGDGFIAQGQSIDTVVGGFYAKISKPVLSDLTIDFGDVVTTMQYPDVLPDLYKGSQLVLVGRYREGGHVHGSLDGVLNGQKHRIPFEADFPAREEASPFVARLWAQKRIDALLSQNRVNGERSEARDEVIALSEQFQILTPYTSMLAVKQPALVASVSPERVKPGDPVISVRAPRDARRVEITLPFGESKLARWDEERGLWSARFLVPAGTADGSYPITVNIEEATGIHRTLALRIRVDTQAPALAARLSPVKAGQPVALRATATLGLDEVWAAVTHRSDPYEAVKALFDLRRVTAHLWDGRDVELTLDERGRGFAGMAETNGSLAPGRYPVVFTALDFAGNASRTEAFVDVASP
jgi:uncharacterized protein YegL